MPKQLKPRPHNMGRWTEARYRSFVMSALRKARWPVKYEVIKQAYVCDMINPESGRRAKFFRCAMCEQLFTQAKVIADHMDPVVDPHTGFIDWNTYIARLYCELHNWQCLCVPCHKTKSDDENRVRREIKEASK